eukprot:2593028-Pyramimonas_sp.AAC.1
MAFTDGSCIQGKFPTLRSAGWSVIVISPSGQVLARAWGAVSPELLPNQSAHASRRGLRGGAGAEGHRGLLHDLQRLQGH